MNIAAWCIKNNRTSILVLLLIVFLGLQSFLTLPRLEDPEIVIRTAMVATPFPGAPPLKVEQLVTDKLEKKIREMEEVDQVDSQSMAGMSLIFVNIQERYKDMKPIWQKLRNKLKDAQPDLPEGVPEPTINDEFGDVFGVVAALIGDGFTYREIKDAADRARDELLKVEDTAKVELFGVQNERIFVDFSNARCAQYGLGPSVLASSLSSQNIIQPGGAALVGPERVVIEPSGEFKSLDQIKKTILRVPGRDSIIYLEDVAEVSRGFVDPPDDIARMNGQPAIVLAVSMAKGGKITDLGPRLLKKLDELEANLPIGLEFKILAYQPVFVEKQINDFLINLLEAFIFVFIVVLIFTGIRTGFVVGALVPMAMLACLAMMPLFNIDLQQVSIASLIIALGILVDNGVVVSEDILVKLASGMDRMKACTEAARTLAVPMLGASLSTIFAFMPIATSESMTGEFVFSLFVVIALTLMASWVLSLTMIPMASYYLLKPKRTERTFSSLFYRIFRGFLVMNLKAWPLHLAGVIFLTWLSVWAFDYVPKMFFPPNDRSMFYVDLTQPYGTDIETTTERAARVEDFLLAQPEVVSAGTFVGNGGPRWYLSLPMEENGNQYARIIVNAKASDDVANLLIKIQNFMNKNMPDTRFTAVKLETGPAVGAPIQIRLAGPDAQALYGLRDKIISLMNRVPGIMNIRDDWGEWTKKLLVEVNQDRAKQAGFTSQDIAQSLQAQISGLPVTEYREGKEVIPIVLRSEDDFRQDVGRIEDLNVYSFQDGRAIPLAQVAQARLAWQPSNIRRRDAQRTMTIKAEVEGRFASEALNDIKPQLEKLTSSADWPSGYEIEFGGEESESSDAQDALMEGVPLACGLIVLLLVWQFNSIRRMLIILLTIPPMMVGITFGLLLTNAPFGFMALLGVISLTGIIINNAIILLDSINADMALGLTAQDAVVASAQKRVRPIIMTALTTIVGLIPLSLQGGELWRPMANTLIFGLAFATVLTLVLCPVLFKLFFNINFKGYKWNPEVLKTSSN